MRSMVLCVLGLGASMASAQPDPGSLPYWPSAERGAYGAYEAALNAIPSPERLREHHDLLASEPHVAGTPGDARTIAHLAGTMRSFGLEVEVHEFWAYLASSTDAELEVVEPEHVRLQLRERALAEDPDTAHPDLPRGWNAYSGSGEVTAGVVYANYGTVADFKALADLGVDVRGKIVLARYGGNYRGFKAKFAEAAGAAGVIIYTDPADSGYGRGIMYPEGGFANETFIQRGSIVTLDQPGDPLTPGAPATEEAHRLDADEIALPRIPVQPVGWGAAHEIMSRMTGAAAPPGWQGGLPLAYRVTGGEALKVRLKVEQERRIVKTANVIGTLRGGEFPEQRVIVGCHHDAWGFGASDPMAGMICLLESARAFMELARQGQRPARSIVFAAWGAEEFGIIGSTEWVEANRAALTRDAVAYLNLDMAAMGPEFGSSAAPSLRRVIAGAAKAVPQARRDGASVFESWGVGGAGGAGGPRFGDLGGGSDHIGFYCHAGVPSASLGGGGSKGTSYHSIYDTLGWYRQVVGDDYLPALMVTRMTSAVASRLADGALVPIDPVAFGAETRRHLVALSERGRALGVFRAPDAGAGMNGRVAPELARLDGAAAQYGHDAGGVYERLLADVKSGRLAGEPLARVNEALIRLDRAWLHKPGLEDRPWFKNLYASNDKDSGYAEWMLPGLRGPIERADADAVAAAEEMYLGVFERMTAVLREIEGELR